VTAGMTVSITYYHNSPDFTPNPNPTRINGCNKSATIAFLANFMITLVAYLALVGSAPFKKRFYHNPLLLGQLIITFIIATL
jgi:glycerol uptake facilitator-like aquaporin